MPLTEHMVTEHVERVRDIVNSSPYVSVSAGGTKPALSGAATLDLAEVSGVLEYDPQEYTFTALAGTPLKEVTSLLAEEGQYLPFDPPFVKAGATLGGTVAAGLSGAERFRYGGVRDFLLGVSFVDGAGQLLRGGGKVVKNAAGLDFPKLLVGSLGRFGVMVELTFKVFPQPETYTSLRLNFPDFSEAAQMMHTLAGSKLELSCLDLLPEGALELRFGGAAAAREKRLERLQTFAGRAGESMTAEADRQLWAEAAAFSWLSASHALLKIPTRPVQVTALEEGLKGLALSLPRRSRLPRRYSVGGNVLWLGWPDAADRGKLEDFLNDNALSALALTGTWKTPQLGKQTGGYFVNKLVSVLDPSAKFATRVETLT